MDRAVPYRFKATDRGISEMEFFADLLKLSAVQWHRDR
jgi:hypothetical protein